MKQHEFHAKYANVPLGERHIVKTWTEFGNSYSKSPFELWEEICAEEHNIEKSKLHIEKLLILAENIIS